MAKKIAEAENRNMENALCRSSGEIVLFPISILFCPLIVLIAEQMINVNVEVLIPPPKEPGAPPINIRKINIISIGIPTIEISTVLKPAVLDIDWKKDVINCE